MPDGRNPGKSNIRGSCFLIDMHFLMFSKKLGDLSVDDVGKVIRGLGLDGVDLTVRPSGHVLPHEVSSRLPRAVDVLRSHDLVVPLITTAVTGVDEPHAAEIFATAAECGVQYVKLGYWGYEGFGSLRRQLEEARSRLSGIADLAKDHGITAVVHIHSGDYLSGTPGLVQRILDGFDPGCVAAYIDPGHMVVEGGRSGWKLGMDLLADLTRVVAVKDFGWEQDRSVAKKWVLKHMPLSAGMVPWTEVFRYLKRMAFDGPVSLHSEYEGLSTSEVVAQTARDFEFIKGVLQGI